MEILGIDLGGTSIKSGLVDDFGGIKELRRTPTPSADSAAKQAIQTLSDLILDYKKISSFEAVGLSVPGIVDSQAGIAKFSGTLGWRNVPIAQEISHRVGLPVFLEHDVTAGGMAEFAFGAAKGFNSAMILAIGTAIAACFVINGKIYRPHSAVGEIGHAPTRNDRPCVCGKTGCLEMTVSGGAIARNYLALSGHSLEPAKVFALAKSGDDQAVVIVDEFYQTLAFGIHFVASTLGPESVIIAGGIADADPDFKYRLEAELDQVLGIQLRPEIRISKLEGTSGCIGAALSAKNRLAAK